MYRDVLGSHNHVPAGKERLRSWVCVCVSVVGSMRVCVCESVYRNLSLSFFVVVSEKTEFHCASGLS